MIWTDEEIKKLSRHFAEETSNGDALDPHIDFATEYASEVIRWLHKNHCIVPKSKLHEKWNEVKTSRYLPAIFRHSGEIPTDSAPLPGISF